MNIRYQYTREFIEYLQSIGLGGTDQCFATAKHGL